MSYQLCETLVYDWFYTNEVGEEYQEYVVGEAGVKEIQYHTPLGEGDKHYCDVVFEDGLVRRIFNISSFVFKR